MHNGCILCGAVGSGKSRTGVGYYILDEGGSLEPLHLPEGARDLYIITTARKRDSKEWYGDLIPFLMHPVDDEHDFGDGTLTWWGNHVYVDSWNNIKKYFNVYNAFFIFDEDRVTGSGVWAKTFLDLARKNHWIILSATPGDKWMDYWAVFVANGFYKNKTHFVTQHVVQNPHVTYFSVKRYLDEYTLLMNKRRVLVEMDYKSNHDFHDEPVWCTYNKAVYDEVLRKRWNIYTDEPIMNASQYGYIQRRIVNSDPSRITMLHELSKRHSKLIIFYNFNYELDMMREAAFSLSIPFCEYNAQHHDPIPIGDIWWYAVQFNAGAEAWNCITTNAMVFYSQNYSYRMTTQAMGRIDRTTSPYKDLYYYHMQSMAPIDKHIAQCLSEKRDFNASEFYGDIVF